MADCRRKETEGDPGRNNCLVDENDVLVKVTGSCG